MRSWRRVHLWALYAELITHKNVNIAKTVFRNNSEIFSDTWNILWKNLWPISIKPPNFMQKLQSQPELSSYTFVNFFWRTLCTETTSCPENEKYEYFTNLWLCLPLFFFYPIIYIIACNKLFNLMNLKAI